MAIGGGVIACGALASAGVGALAVRHGAEWLLADILRSNLPADLLDETAIARFVSAYGPTFKRRYRHRRLLAWLYDRVTPVDVEQVDLLERDVITNFLMGSDMFRPGRAQGRPLEYTGVTPACSNPFYRT